MTIVKKALEDLSKLKPEETIFIDWFTKEDCEDSCNGDREHPALTEAQWGFIRERIVNNYYLNEVMFETVGTAYREVLGIKE